MGFHRLLSLCIVFTLRQYSLARQQQKRKVGYGKEKGQSGTLKDERELTPLLHHLRLGCSGWPVRRPTALPMELHVHLAQDSEKLKEEIWQELKVWVLPQ